MPRAVQFRKRMKLHTWSNRISHQPTKLEDVGSNPAVCSILIQVANGRAGDDVKLDVAWITLLVP